jgi:hypothetical protein
MPTWSDPSYSTFIHSQSTSRTQRRPQLQSSHGLTSRSSGYAGGGVLRLVIRYIFTSYFFTSPFPNFTERTIPAPSFTTINWFGFTSFNVSTAPLGQRISSNSTFSAFPIPK